MGRSTSIACWFLLGLINNTPYVIMLAAAKFMSEGGTSIVYIANTLPGLLVKLSSPYWFDCVSYRYRLLAASGIMGLAFVCTGWFSQESMQISDQHRIIGQLVGVAMVSVQIGLGEASLLALAGKQDLTVVAGAVDGAPPRKSGVCLLAFSSGTGLAGPVGFLWKVGLSEFLGLSVSLTLFLGIILAVSYWCLFRAATSVNAQRQEGYQTIHPPIEQELEEHQIDEQELDDVGNLARATALDDSQQSVEADGLERTVIPISQMSVTQRFQLVLSLWPYIIPLFTVYAAEYACQAGAWTAIGFPVQDIAARAKFYEQSNWLYQVGTFVSRSSGALLTVSIAILWLMPILQSFNLCFFVIVAVKHGFFYKRGILLSGSFYTGLLGGAVYVHGYKRIVADMPHEHTEFALSSTCVAEALGVLAADVTGLFLQSCLYKRNGLSGALANCPL